MRTTISLILILMTACVAQACVAQPPDVNVDAGNDAPVCAPLATVRTTLLVRFWRGREELSCADALAGGLRVVVGPQGSSVGWSPAPEYVCTRMLNADPAQRQLTGIYTYDQPSAIWATRVENASGEPVTADTTVYFDVPTCARGSHYQFVTYALPPEVITAGRT